MRSTDSPPDFYGQSPAGSVVRMNILGVDIDSYFPLVSSNDFEWVEASARFGYCCGL